MSCPHCEPDQPCCGKHAASRQTAPKMMVSLAKVAGKVSGIWDHAENGEQTQAVAHTPGTPCACGSQAHNSSGHTRACCQDKGEGECLAKDPDQPTVLLVGNPNVGKSTLFNRLTGSHQRVVNAPGTTVHVMAGMWKNAGIRILDLPGTYSLIATSLDEQVVCDTLLGAPGSLTHNTVRGGDGHVFSLLGHAENSPEVVHPAYASPAYDAILLILDGGSMTRSLYLLAQVARVGKPVAAIVTMGDVAAQNGTHINEQALEQELGIPVRICDPRNARSEEIVHELITQTLSAPHMVAGIEPALARDLERAISPQQSDISNTPQGHKGPNEVGSEEIFGNTAEIFEWIEAVESRVLDSHMEPAHLSRSDKIDRLLLHPVIGTVTFFALLWMLFNIAGNWLGPIQDWCEGIFSSTQEGAISLANGLNYILGLIGLEDSWVSSMLIGGIVSGMGVVASFFPLMLVIYAAISLLEDSGYMARVAFLADRLMRRLGLDGRVILPLIIGFGCNVPSLAAARTIPSSRQRLVTVLITPFTSCAARLTIYLMIGKVFFGHHAGAIVWIMYLLSMLFIVAGAWVLKFFITREASTSPLMLVLPAYQMPRLVVIVRATWMRAWSFVTGAGKIIVTMSFVVWLMGAIPVHAGYGFTDDQLTMEDSLYGATAHVLEPAFAPTGFGEWHMTGALMTGFVAKETVVSSIVTSYNLDEQAAGDAEENGDNLGQLPRLLHSSLEESAGRGNEKIAAFAFLVFVLAYTPCMATVAEQAKLIGGKKTALAVGVQLIAAWVVATLIFQIGRILFGV